MDKATAIKQKAQAHIQRGALKEALAEYQRLLTLTPIDPYAYILLGDLAVRMGSGDESIHRYKQAADAYETLGFYRNAIAVLKKVLRLDAGQVDQLRRLADLYSREGLLAESVDHYLDFGLACLKRNRKDDTKQVLEILAQLGTPNIKVSMRIVSLCEAVGDRDRGAGELVRMAAVLESKGQAQKAKEMRARAAELAPGMKIGDSLSLGGRAAALPADAVLDLGKNVEGGAPARKAAPPFTAMPGLERSGGLFAPVREPEAIPVAKDIDRGGKIPGSDAETETAPAPALDLGALERAARASGSEGADMGGVSETVAAEAPEVEAVEVEEIAATEAVEETEPLAAPAAGIDVAAMAAEDLDEAEITVAEDVTPSGPEAEIAALVRAWEGGQHDRGTAFKLADLASSVGDAKLEARWLTELGELALDQGKWEEARNFYTRALGLDPGQSLATRRVERLARIADSPTETSEARPAAARAEPFVIPADPAPMTAEAARMADEPPMAPEPAGSDNGSSGGIVGDADVAQVIDHFREAIGEQLSATDHASHYDLGMTYFEMDLIEEAVPEFQKALGGIAVRRQCLELLASCYSRLGSPDRAATHERAAMAADQGDGGEVELRYELACCLEDAGHLEDARAVLRQVLTQAPGYGDARERLAALEAV